MAEAAAAGAIAAPIVGGLIGASEGGKSRKQQRDFLERALAEFQGITTPTGDIILPELAGTYSPEMEQLIQLGPSALENISIDPKFREAQMQALSQLAEVSKGGLTEADLAAMRELRRQVAGEERGRELAIQQEMARRGMAGSGQELAARLLESQAGANREAAGADRLSQIAQNRALQAITQQGALAGNIRGQEFAEKSNVARAMDAISAWNAANQQALQQRNIAAQNQASLRNLAERQRIEEAKAAAQNAAVQQQFQNQLALAGQKAGVYGSLTRCLWEDDTRLNSIRHYHIF